MRTALLVSLLFAVALQSPAQTTGEKLLQEGVRLEEQGRLDDAARNYAKARDLATQTGDRKALADALASSGYLHYYRGNMNQALVDSQRAYEIYNSIHFADGTRLTLSYIAHIYADSSVGQYDRAIEYYLQLLPQYESAGEKDHVADMAFDLASTYDLKGDLAKALEWYRRALATEESIGRLGEAAYVKRSIGVTLGKLGRGEEALPILNDALRFYGTKDPERANHVRQSRGVVYRRLGRYNEAIADLEITRAYFQKNDNERFLEKTEDELALAYAGAGRWQDAYRLRTTDAELRGKLAEKLREEHTSRLRVQFDAEKKEQENRALLRQSAANARIRRLQNAVLALSAIVIAVLAYLAFRLVRDARRMRVMAMTDELTRLPNRRHLLALAEAELHRARGAGQTFAIVALDIDHFKRVNDEHGHAAGDAVLQRVARACRTALRATDFIGRTGGEEFIAVLPGTRARDAFAIAERLRIAVESIDLSDVAPGVHATISAGVAEWNASDETVARLTARADELLYAAKESGRNRVCMAGA